MILQFVFCVFCTILCIIFLFFCFSNERGNAQRIAHSLFRYHYYGLHRLQGTYPILMTSSLLPV